LGINLMLSPTISARFALAGMTSALGRCHTLDDRADGYARAEATFALAIGMERTAPFALLRGAVRQDGQAASPRHRMGWRSSFSSALRSPMLLLLWTLSISTKHMGLERHSATQLRCAPLL
jgi:hypothetical protein